MTTDNQDNVDLSQKPHSSQLRPMAREFYPPETPLLQPVTTQEGRTKGEKQVREEEDTVRLYPEEMLPSSQESPIKQNEQCE